MGTDQSFVALEELVRMRGQRETRRKNCFERDCKLVVVVVLVIASDVAPVVPVGLVSGAAPAVVSASLPTPEMEEEEEEPVVVVDNVVVVVVDNNVVVVVFVVVVVVVMGWKTNHCEPKTTPKGRGQDHY